MALIRSEYQLGTFKSPLRRVALKRTISEKMIAANRRNSLKSTGPKTLQGKSWSMKNAVKHGILCQGIISRGLLTESVPEYIALLSDFMAQLEPVGTFEILLVQEIVNCFWRKGRALRAESAEIEIAKKVVLGKEPYESALQWNKTFWGGNSSGIDAMMCSFRKEVVNNGSLSDESLRRLDEEFSFAPEAGRLLRALNARAKATHETQALESGRQAATSINSIVTTLEELRLIDQSRSIGFQDDIGLISSIAQSQSVPPEAAMNRILRYETTLDRKITRAMATLAYLQDRRKGIGTPRLLS